MGWLSHRGRDSAQWLAVTSNEIPVRSLYAFDVLSAEPRGSIEAATLALLDNGG
jgi:hypothetical protein